MYFHRFQFALLVALLMVLRAPGIVRGQVSSGDAVESSPGQEKAWAERAAQLALAEAQSYDIRLGRADGPQLKLADKPALKWSNTDDATIHGSVLLWMHDGRPEAIASIFKFFTVKDEFSAELHSLAEGPLSARKGGQIVWQPDEAGVTFAPLADVAAPAKSAPARLAQMRGIARNFTGTMTTFDQTTHALRLLTQPLARYAADSNTADSNRADSNRADSNRADTRGLVDGTIFAFARATDPDVLLILEARADGELVRWHYALARMHCGALAMRYQDREVWSKEQMEHPFARPKGVYTLLQGIPEPNARAEKTLNPEPIRERGGGRLRPPEL